ncbi:MAG: HEAT repeat domain-containing protein [Pirellulaceae bacterium]
MNSRTRSESAPNDLDERFDESADNPASASFSAPLSSLRPAQPRNGRYCQSRGGTGRDLRKIVLYGLSAVGLLSVGIVCVWVAISQLETSTGGRISDGMRSRSATSSNAVPAQAATPVAPRKGLEQLCDEIVANLTETINVLASIRDEASLQAARPRLSTLATQQAGLYRAMNDPQAVDLSLAEAQRVPEIGAAFQSRFESLQQRLTQELIRISSISGALEIAMELRKATGVADASDRGGGDSVEQALAAIKSPDLGQRMFGLLALSRLAPTDDRRKEVAAAVAELASNADPGTRSTAMQVLATWYVPETIPKMIQLASDPDSSTRFAAINFLANLHDSPEAAQAVAARLVEDGYQAAMALQSMGPVAEESVWPYLNHEDRMVRMQAFQTLSAIGTEKSLTELERYLNHEDIGTRTYAQQVANAIRSRQ